MEQLVKIFITGVIIAISWYLANREKDDDDDDNSNTGNWNFSL